MPQSQNEQKRHRDLLSIVVLLGKLNLAKSESLGEEAVVEWLFHIAI